MLNSFIYTHLYKLIKVVVSNLRSFKNSVSFFLIPCHTSVVLLLCLLLLTLKTLVSCILNLFFNTLGKSISLNAPFLNLRFLKSLIASDPIVWLIFKVLVLNSVRNFCFFVLWFINFRDPVKTLLNVLFYFLHLLLGQFFLCELIDFGFDNNLIRLRDVFQSHLGLTLNYCLSGLWIF